MITITCVLSVTGEPIVIFYSITEVSLSLSCPYLHLGLYPSLSSSSPTTIHAKVRASFTAGGCFRLAICCGRGAGLGLREDGAAIPVICRRSSCPEAEQQLNFPKGACCCGGRGGLGEGGSVLVNSSCGKKRMEDIPLSAGELLCTAPGQSTKLGGSAMFKGRLRSWYSSVYAICKSGPRLVNSSKGSRGSIHELASLTAVSHGIFIASEESSSSNGASMSKSGATISMFFS
jgi:hypothetical protein